MLLVKFFEEVSGDAFVMSFREAQAEEQAGQAGRGSHVYAFCRSMPSSITARTFWDRLMALRPRGSTRK